MPTSLCLPQDALFSTGADGQRPTPDLLQLLERAASAGSWMLVMPERRLVWSAHLAELLGRASAQPLAWEDFPEIFCPEWRGRMRSVLSACLASGTAFDEEAQLLTTGGQRLWVRALGEVVRDATGAVIHLSGVIRDLTVQKRAEQEAQSLTMRLATTLASINDAFVTVDREGRLTYLNPESERLIGRPGAALLGLPIWDALDGDGVAQLRHNLTAAFGNASHHEFEAYYTIAGKWLELRVYPFEEGLALYLRDVTERRQSQE
ncbi:MAG: PAS domain-containing protein, partial [Polaromonas sp.]|nr:PAS domain-containing protein [Polaromonas sp.]